MMKKSINNSWYFSKPLYQCTNLLGNQNKRYIAHFYHCSCGFDETILSDEVEMFPYVCEGCGNEAFINGYNAGESDFYILGRDLEVSYVCKSLEDAFEAVAYIDIPVNTDFMRKMIIFEKYDIAYYRISMNGLVERKNIFLKNENVESILEAMLREYIIERYENASNISILQKKWLHKEEKSAAILFFLSHPKLKDFAFYYWDIDTSLVMLDKPKNELKIESALLYLLNGRKERSVKRALYTRHKILQDKIRNLERYFSFTPEAYTFDPRTPFIICRCFDDPNIASRLLAEEFTIFYGHQKYEESHYEMNNELELHDVIWFIHFLKKQYGEKQIAKMLLSIDENMQEWLDMTSLIPLYKRVIKKEFRRVKLTVQHLHNEIIRCGEDKENEQIKQMKFTYVGRVKRADIKIGDLEFRLPYTGAELSMWAVALHNCMAGYAQAIQTGRTVIYGVFKHDAIVYAVEVFNNEMRQCSGKYNTNVDVEDMATIGSWLDKFFKKHKY